MKHFSKPRSHFSHITLPVGNKVLRCSQALFCTSVEEGEIEVPGLSSTNEDDASRGKMSPAVRSKKLAKDMIACIEEAATAANKELYDLITWF